MRAPATLDALFAPRSVAIIGASNDSNRIGGRPLRYLREAGFAGAVYPVNPRRNEVQGLRAYADVRDIPGPVDLAIVIVSADLVVETIEACAEKGIGCAIIFSSGFAEVGPEGARRQQRIEEIARAAGMRLLGPNCLGAFNSHSGFFGTFTQAFDTGVMFPGELGVVSQSGAAGAHLAYMCRQRCIGIGHWITTGNEADIEVSECVEWMALAPHVKVIALFVEAIRNGPRFVRALEAAREHGKPVIAIKVGRSAAGALAAASHTGALVGEDKIYDAVLRQHGAYRAESIDELLDLTYASLQGRFPSNSRLGIVTTSGGLGILAADAAVQVGLAVAPLNEGARGKITAMIPFAGTRNPIDVTAQGVNEPILISRSIACALNEGGYGSLVCFLTSAPAVPSIGTPLLQALVSLRQDHPDAVIALEMVVPPEIRRQYEEAGFLVFEDLHRAIRTLHALDVIRNGFALQPSCVPDAPAATALPDVADEYNAKLLLGRHGIPVLAERVVSTPAQAAEAAREVGLPVVLKIVSPDIPHKTEVGGVVLDVRTVEAAEEQARALLHRVAEARPDARISGILVSPMRSGGIESICGVVNDAVFGPVVVFGLGGIHVELLRDVSFRLAPFDEAEAHRMIREIRGAQILLGARGGARGDVDALARSLAALSRFAVAHRDQVAEVDINPMMVLPEGEGVVALDALIVRSESARPQSVSNIPHGAENREDRSVLA
ncbi:acetate--CoA ligase family protein [Bradyrhizobium diazoefficiens]